MLLLVCGLGILLSWSNFYMIQIFVIVGLLVFSNYLNLKYPWIDVNQI